MSKCLQITCMAAFNMAQSLKIACKNQTLQSAYNLKDWIWQRPKAQCFISHPQALKPIVTLHTWILRQYALLAQLLRVSAGKL